MDNDRVISHQGMGLESVGAEKCLISVPYVHQCYSWDCGLACVSMILEMFQEPCSDVYTKDLDFLQCGESVWTIDLAYILNRHNVRVCLYTVTIGVHESHHRKAFYRDNAAEDTIRVTKMFDNAMQSGVQVEKRSLSLEDIMCHLQKDNPIISLVDWTHMRCERCDSKLKKCWSCIACHMGRYQGHYVVVCGFDKKKELIYYKNPDSKTHDTCCIPMNQFDRARMSDGTDEDTLYIYNTSFHGSHGDFVSG